MSSEIIGVKTILDGWEAEHFENNTTGGGAKSETINPPKMVGWIFPVCGRGLSPYTSYCPCKGFVQGEWKITC